MLGRLADVERTQLKARRVAFDHNQILTVARIDMNLGELYTIQGQPAKALHRFQQARQTFTDQQNTMEVGTALVLEAALFQRIGALREAHRNYRQAQIVFTKNQMHSELGRVLVYLSEACRRAHDFEHASELLDEAEQLWQQLEQPLWLVIIHLERIALALDQANAKQALRLIEQPLSVTENLVLTTQYRLLRAETLRRFGKVPTDFDEAQLAYKRALRSAETLGNPWFQRQALMGLGELSLPNDPYTALEFFTKSA